MSTRSNIGIINRNGTVEMVYCHNDGYPSYNGWLLLEHWSNEDKVRELLALGSLSSLDKEIGKKHGFDYEDHPVGQCTFYGRDRGETGVGSRKYKNANQAEMEMEEYLYLWDCKTNSWIFSDHGNGFRPLTQLACQQD